MNITTATPAEIDAELSRLCARQERVDVAISNAQRWLQAKDEADADPRPGLYNRPRIDREAAQARQDMPKLRAEFRELQDGVVRLNAEYIRRGTWARYYLVDGGHLHYDVSGSRCSRIPSTTHYWMTEFSGMPSKMVIAKAQERVCTTCFPDAPVNPRKPHPRFMTMTEAERAAYAEDKARKAAAKKAAEMRDADGQPLVADDGMFKSTLKTDRAAWNWLMREAESLGLHGEQDDTIVVRESAGRVLAALAKARGVEVETLRIDLNTKTAKKAKRDGWTVLATF